MSYGSLHQTNKWTILVFFAGIVYISITLSAVFVGKLH
jgi:hypothetical protein